MSDDSLYQEIKNAILGDSPIPDIDLQGSMSEYYATQEHRSSALPTAVSDAFRRQKDVIRSLQQQRDSERERIIAMIEAMCGEWDEVAKSYYLEERWEIRAKAEAGREIIAAIRRPQ